MSLIKINYIEILIFINIYQNLATITNRLKAEKQHKAYRSLKVSFSAIEYSMKYIDPRVLVNRTVKIRDSSLFLRDIQGKNLTVHLNDFDSIYLVGAGKATAGMAEALYRLLNGMISDSAITVPYHTVLQISGVSITRAGHPIPDKAGVLGTQRIIDIVKKAKKSDLIFVLISGGGSALMPMPAQGMTISDKQQITNTIMSRGASIHEINIIRKHLSRIKGGQLIRFVNNSCTVVSLILSDVIGDNMEIVASGPTVPDSSTFKDAEMILKKYDMWGNKIGDSPAKKIILDGLAGVINDTPKPGDPIFENVHNLLIGNNDLFCKKASAHLRRYGLQVLNLGSSFDGEAQNFGTLLAKLAKGIKKPSVPFAFVLGGETTVKMNRGKNNGMGGRNQEAIVAAAIKSYFRFGGDTTILCMGTDGIDGNSTAAGGFLTPKTMSAIKEKKIDLKEYLQNHNSHNILKKLDSLIITGRTGTNVNDISIICRLN